MTVTKPLSFSIVINTDARSGFLSAYLSSFLHLDYPSYEVCIVCGPTQDGTDEIVDKFDGIFKIGRCKERNLSKSRNIGIAMSSGDVIAFIDDDAVPEPEWLKQLAAGYFDHAVGGVGGFVYDNTGARLQCGFVTTDRLARPNTNWNRAVPELCFPYSRVYPHLLGTNASFRRTALLEIGGFDEEYEYFLDETDVCCRLVDHGYQIVQLDHAFVHHKYAPSSIRDERNIVLRWYPLIKNRVYFALKNGQKHHSFAECVKSGTDDIESWTTAVESNTGPGGCYTFADRDRFRMEVAEAMRDGIERGLAPERKLLGTDTIAAHQSSFLPVTPIQPRGGRLTICFVSQDYPPGQNGGIARYIHQLAGTLGSQGHNVHVITKGGDFDRVDYEDHVWVHRLKAVHHDLPVPGPIAPLVIPQHIWNWSQSALSTVWAINSSRAVNMVYAPVWDAEGIAFLYCGKFPLVTSLQTTMQHWLESYPHRRQDSDWMRIFGSPIAALEGLLMEYSWRIHSISKAIAIDAERLYSVSFVDRIIVAPLGLRDWRDKDRVISSNQNKVLFVGRLERRKGIDVLLKVAPRLLAEHKDWILEIVGDDTIEIAGGGTYRTQFELVSLDSEVRDRIRFHGKCDEDQLRQFYESCDIFVAPSRFESFGLISLEAMMFAKPVVACRTGGMPEVVADGFSGILAEPGDPESLHGALQSLMRDTVLRLKMGGNGRTAYEQHFTDVAMVQNLQPLLDLVRTPRTQRTLKESFSSVVEQDSLAREAVMDVHTGTFDMTSATADPELARTDSDTQKSSTSTEKRCKGIAEGVVGNLVGWELNLPDAAAGRYDVASPANHFGELLLQHDEHFVHGAYMTILGRAPDPSGAAHYLARLRAGECKMRIVSDLAFSREATGRPIASVPGLRSAIFQYRLATIPILGRILGSANWTVANTREAARLRAFENLFAVLQRTGVNVHRQSESIREEVA